ncbi:hypothetical protein MBLNU457_1969t2 [Dothideomycetes sp. NU457]
MSISSRIERLRELAEAEQRGEESAHHSLLTELRQLQLAIETPIETTARVNFQVLLSESIHTTKKHVLMAMSDFAKYMLQNRDRAELSAVSGEDELLIVRLMRVLSTTGFIEEVGVSEYASNAVTRHAVTPGAIGALKHHYDLDMAMGGRLVEYMRRAPDKTIYQFAGEPQGCQTLFDFTHGHATIFGLISSDTDKGREQKKAFDEYMAAKRPPASMKQWFETYPVVSKFSDAKADADSVLIVDVGGGPGQELVGLKQAHPQLPGRYVLQDLPITLDRISASSPMMDGIEKMPYDFFIRQPVRGARAYFMRDIMHNWSDAKCTLILRNIADAMDCEYSTLLIDQYVLPSTHADLRAAEMDILMLLHTSGLQRTVPIWEKLFAGAGLEIVKIWNGQGSLESVIEVKKKR